jgi:hypothetical protein
MSWRSTASSTPVALHQQARDGVAEQLVDAQFHPVVLQ